MDFSALPSPHSVHSCNNRTKRIFHLQYYHIHITTSSWQDSISVRAVEGL